MIKNQTITLEITDMTAEGAGVGRYEGMAVFIPNTAVGDIISAKIVKVKSSYAYGITEKIITISEDRIKPDCPHFPKCGGCVFRHINYDAELKIKANRVAQAIKRIAGTDIPFGGIVGAEETHGYRNKAQFPFSTTCETGFFAPRSHRVIPIKKCMLLPQKFNKIADCVSEFLSDNNISVYNEETKKGLARHLFIRKGSVSGEIMVVLVINGDTLPDSDLLVSNLKSLLGKSLKSVQININKKDTNVILGDKAVVLYGEPVINDTLCGANVCLSPFTFYQVNHDMAEKLYKKAAEYAQPINKTVIDLYCGAGTIGLSMAKQAKKIIGIEIVPQAIENAKSNARNNGIKNARFICGDAAAAAKVLSKNGENADVVILDPPRKGCEESLLHTVAKDFAPERIVYVSCDPGTLARDIKTLLSLGYTAKEYTVFDMFPRTAHVETVCLMSR